MSEQLIMHGDYEVLCKFIEDAIFMFNQMLTLNS